MIKRSLGEIIFDVFNCILLGLFGLSVIYPLFYCLSASFSGYDAFINGDVVLFPKNFTLSAYEYILSDTDIWLSYANTVFYTVFGTFASISVSVFGAYALSKSRLRGRKIINFFLMFTMWFHAGMIPFYLNIGNLGLHNTRTAIIFAFACSTFNIILLRTYFQGVPKELEEAAMIDGANDLYVLFKIFIPVSIPAIATITLFYAVSRWNAYFWTMILLTDDRKMPLQVILKQMLTVLSQTDEFAMMNTDTSGGNYAKETVIYATIIVAALPMLVVYPFIQKFFIKGVMIGAIKG
jgi:putative aldouronate transport system permease protein